MILDNPSGNGGRNTAVDVLRVLAGIVDDIEKNRPSPIGPKLGGNTF